MTKKQIKKSVRVDKKKRSVMDNEFDSYNDINDKQRLVLPEKAYSKVYRRSNIDNILSILLFLFLGGISWLLPTNWFDTAGIDNLPLIVRSSFSGVFGIVIISYTIRMLGQKKLGKHVVSNTYIINKKLGRSNVMFFNKVNIFGIILLSLAVMM